MVRGIHLAVSVLAAAPLVVSPTSTPCEDCGGTFCSYETSSAAGFGICYGSPFTGSDDCHSTYGALDVIYGGTPTTPKLKVAKIDPASECDAVAKDLVAANVMKFDNLAADTLSEVTTCAKCLETASDNNKWCQYKDGTTVLEGGFCALSAGSCVDLAATEISSIGVSTLTTASECPTTTTTTTTAPADDCTKCLAGDGKAYCGYTTNNDDKTPLYYACVAADAECPVMEGINSIFAGLQDSTKVRSQKIAKGEDCSAFKSLKANLDLAATPANTDKKTCGECVKANAKWCNYVSKTSDKKDGPTGGYCGVKTTCAVFTKFNEATITNDPANPQDTCDGVSSAFGLSSAVTLTVAATCAAATVLA